jgi:hypothetical protein
MKTGFDIADSLRLARYHDNAASPEFRRPPVLPPLLQARLLRLVRCTLNRRGHIRLQ